jgi:hypothetical protein
MKTYTFSEMTLAFGALGVFLLGMFGYYLIVRSALEMRLSIARRRDEMEILIKAYVAVFAKRIDAQGYQVAEALSGIIVEGIYHELGSLHEIMRLSLSWWVTMEECHPNCRPPPREPMEMLTPRELELLVEFATEALRLDAERLSKGVHVDIDIKPKTRKGEK